MSQNCEIPQNTYLQCWRSFKEHNIIDFWLPEIIGELLQAHKHEIHMSFNELME